MSHADAAIEYERLAVEFDCGPLRQIFGGDGDIILRTQMNGDFRERLGGHSGNLGVRTMTPTR